MEKIHTLSEAFDYVNQRDFFDTQNYPVIEEFKDNEKKFFALKHTLLHMQQHIADIVHYEQLGLRQLHKCGRNNSFVKIIVNMIEVSNLVGLSPIEIDEKIKPIFRRREITCAFLFMMKDIATYCALFDRKKKIQDETEELIYFLKIKDSLKETWTNLIEISNSLESRKKFGMNYISLDEIICDIPRILEIRRVYLEAVIH